MLYAKKLKIYHLAEPKGKILSLQINRIECPLFIKMRMQNYFALFDDQYKQQ